MENILNLADNDTKWKCNDDNWESDRMIQKEKLAEEHGEKNGIGELLGVIMNKLD